MKRLWWVPALLLGFIIGLALIQPPFLQALRVSPGTVAHTHADVGQGGTLNLATTVVTGTLAQFNTAVSNADLASLAGIETLTGKTIGDTLASTKACASGYTRQGPNFCQHLDLVGTTWADATACTERTLSPAVPAGAKAAILQIRWQALSSNVIGTRENTVAFWTDSTCLAPATAHALSEYRIREFATVTAGTILAKTDSTMIVPLTTTNTVWTTQLTGGGNGNADIQLYFVVGYLD